MLSEAIKMLLMVNRVSQKNIKIKGDGDVVAGNKIVNNYDSDYTRLKRLFDALCSEFTKNEKLTEVCEELNRYLTEKDTIGLEKKLFDAGYKEDYILDALEQKEYFSKKLYHYKEYDSAQKIYVDLLALIKTSFQDYIYPLIEEKATDSEIKSAIREKVINPIIEILNIDGAQDNVLNLNAEEVKGMIFYLTGMCHIKWTI